jgi:hypothetical protein
MTTLDSPVLKLEGRSGCKLEVLNREGVFSVKKISKEENYNARLLLQAEKQQQFYTQGSFVDFKAPQVLHRSATSDLLTWFEMPYLHGQKYSEFFERASVLEIRKLGDKFNQYFKSSFEKAEAVKIDSAQFVTKLNAIQSLLADRTDIDLPLLRQTLEYLSRIPANFIPLRPCHGDFTFSNMLFCEDGIYLVDFLDSFVESPLIDLVKFRQDTFFYWTLLIENQLPENRSAKIIQIFNYLDGKVFESLSGNKFVKEWYNYLQVFNLLRILPYVNHRREIEFVQKSIQRIIPIT